MVWVVEKLSLNFIICHIILAMCIYFLSDLMQYTCTCVTYIHSCFIVKNIICTLNTCIKTHGCVSAAKKDIRHTVCYLLVPYSGIWLWAEFFANELFRSQKKCTRFLYLRIRVVYWIVSRMCACVWCDRRLQYFFIPCFYQCLFHLQYKFYGSRKPYLQGYLGQPSWWRTHVLSCV